MSTAMSIPDDDIPEVETHWMTKVIEAAKGKYSNCLEKTNPKVVALALQMRADGCGYHKIQRATGCGISQLERMFRVYAETVEERRKSMAHTHGTLAEAYTELGIMKAQRLMDDPDKLDEIDPSKLAVTAAIHTDKHMALSGMATTVIEHRSGVSIEDAQALIAEAKAKVAMRLKESAIEAEVIEHD